MSSEIYGLDEDDLWDASQYVMEWRNSDNCDDTPEHRERLLRLAKRLQDASNSMCAERRAPAHAAD